MSGLDVAIDELVSSGVQDISQFVRWDVVSKYFFGDPRDQCCNCGQSGHLAKDCPWPRPEMESER